MAAAAAAAAAGVGAFDRVAQEIAFPVISVYKSPVIRIDFVNNRHRDHCCSADTPLLNCYSQLGK